MANIKKHNRCKALTNAGKSCRAAATGGGLCFFHSNPNKASELGRIGGRKNRHIAPSVEPLPSLDSALAVWDTVNRLISDVYSGKVDPKTASGLASLLTLQLRAIGTADPERNVAELQRQLAEGISRQNHGSIVPSEKSENGAGETDKTLKSQQGMRLRQWPKNGSDYGFAWLKRLFYVKPSRHFESLFKMMMNMANEPTKIVVETIMPNVRGRDKSSGAHFYFWFFAAVSCLAFWAPIKNLIAFSLTHDYGSHILLVAPMSILLVYLKRQKIFSLQAGPNRKRTIIAGSSLFLLGLFFLLISKYQALRAEKLSIEILSLVVLWISAFIFCYGTAIFAKARFPVLFLLLLVPVPQFLIDKVVFALQAGSCDVAYGLLRVLGVPVLQEGFKLRLPVIDLEVAKECSGIRSSIALLLTVLVAGEFVLRSGWSKLLFAISIIPILVIKNGIRIVTIYLLTAYVNLAFLHGWLHTSGGIVFYLLGLIAMIPVAVLLRRWQDRHLALLPMHAVARVTPGSH